ncbi:RINGv domain-containing protein [Cephalotus follicularis]|uniref:RINGv domain-containing protein n=1 Tax=Cephalotus follicularis TaxID=3775 RepID=A0A1Q3BBT1_CEPFO|nr:RINGv domain-containing protein [Cephalotus follicularis]
MSQGDLGQGTHRSSRSDVSICFSDAEDGGSCYSQFYSTTGGSYDDYSTACVSDAEIGRVGVSVRGGGDDSRRVSSVSDCSVEVEMESGLPEIKVHLANAERVVERDCRICHLGLESNIQESGVPIDLGCSCKDDLAAAHKQCAEAWFKIKGNKICEICHSMARNVIGANEVETTFQSNETINATAATAVSAPAPHAETRSFWHGHRFLNFLLACMVFAFVISWLFHFNVPSA